MFKRQARQQRAFCYIRFFNYEFFWFNSLTRAKDCCIIIKRSELTAPRSRYISWARSSVGRAFGSHPRGQGFESLRVHQKEKSRQRLFFLFSLHFTLRYSFFSFLFIFISSLRSPFFSSFLSLLSVLISSLRSLPWLFRGREKRT